MMVVARMRIRLTVPDSSPMVITSPMRTGRSNKMMMPEIKLAKISCKPKPSPTPSAATSHCILLQDKPSEPRVIITPIMTMT